MFFTLCVIAFIFCFTLWYFKADKLDHVLCPPGWMPIAGNMFQILEYGDDLISFSLDHALKFNFRTFAFSVPGPKTMILALKPNLVEYILKGNFENYPKGDIFHEMFEETLGGGIFNIDGPRWLKKRKLASHMFNTRNLRDCMLKVFVEHGNKLVKVIKAHGEREIDLQDYFFRYTFDSICKIAFGLDVCSLDKPVAFGHAFDRAQFIVARRFSDPFWKLKRPFGLGNEAEMKVHQKTIDRTVRSMVAARRAEKDFSGRGDLLSLFLQQAEEEGSSLSDTELRDIIVNFMIAGRDTTACLLSWTFFEFSEHPDCMARVEEEILRVCGPKGREPSVEQLRALPYTEALLMEALRLHPSVPADFKVAQKDDTLPDGTAVKAGNGVAYMPYIMGRDPSLWPQPLEFRPERFLSAGAGVDSPPSIQQPSPFLYPAFNAGPRTCLGRYMAMLEAKLVLVMLLQHFRVAFEGKLSGEHLFSVTMSLKHGVPTRLTPRA